MRQTNPVLGVVARLLELADARVTASEVLDLADREPVRRRFRLDDDDVARAEGWVAASGIRWGLDAPHRQPFRLERFSGGTWQAGLDRVLVGVTTTEADSRLVGGVLPLDDVGSSDIDLAGRLTELVHRLGHALDALARAQPLHVWADAILEAADALTATAPRDAWQRQELANLLADVLAEATADAEPARDAPGAGGRPRAPGRPPPRPPHARELPHRPPHRLHARADARGPAPRGLPARPRRRGLPAHGHARRRRPRPARPARGRPRRPARGPPAPARRAHVRQRRVLITYSGKDERTNAPRPPAVPVGELLDVVDRTVRVPDGRPRDRIVVEHPLQAFDPRNFTPGELRTDAPWGFDAPTLAGARALEGPRTSPGRFLPGPLPDVPGPVVEVDDLVRFVQKPVRTFLRRRLGITVGDYDDEIEDALPIELDDLEKYGVGNRLLDTLLHGADAAGRRRRRVRARVPAAGRARAGGRQRGLAEGRRRVHVRA